MNKSELNIRKIKLNQVVFIPLVTLFFCISLIFIFFYFSQIKKNKDLSEKSLNSLVHSNIDYLISDLYQNNTEAITLRFDSIIFEYQDIYANAKLCLGLAGSSLFTSNINIEKCDLAARKKPSIVKEYELLLYGKKLGFLKTSIYFDHKDIVYNTCIVAFFVFISLVFSLLTGHLIAKKNFYNLITPLFTSLINTEKDSAIAQIAVKVSHDIRSPLTALEMSLKDIPTISEQNRIMARDSIARIKNIANNLLEKRREINKAGNYSDDISIKTSLVSLIIESIVSEKRTQNLDNKNIQIDTTLNESTYGIFIKVDESEFKGILSNIINNSIEAISKKGIIIVELEPEENTVKLRIRDNGKGISPEILAKLGHKESSFGKEKGNGIGIYYAKKTIDLWGGTFGIKSILGEGTEVTIELPRSEPPNWFINKLEVKCDIVILDDDETIHHVWNKRLASLKARGVSIHHFYTSEKVMNWFKKNRNADHVFLCDFELIGDKYDGIKIIEELGVAKNSILVTSLFEERAVKERCEKMGVKIIPKPLSSIIPIEFKNSSLTTIKSNKKKKDIYVYVENDKYLRWSWASVAKSAGVDLVTFESPLDFKTSKMVIPKESTFYIDRDFGALDKTKGEDFAKELYDQGYRNLYLSTGYPSKNIGCLYWLKGIVGKNSPWS